MSSWGRPMFLGCLARPGLLFKNDQLLSLGFPSRENWQKNQLISIILQWLTELSWEDGTWGHVWSPVWSENEHSRSAQDGWGQEENHGWGYGDIVFRETSKLYSTEMNNKSVQKKAIINFRKSNIPGKSSIGAHKPYSLTGNFYVVRQFGPFQQI